ncbi:hypothetical protein DSO57_1017913 [Entomophthora muscae]|uniref:Uncharacterized protein n=1 Tax=Entomophthora muscae TaxID=34485 RepID=A0ACC2S6I6_9FUNG|nr:hypothetical protein DSO57_1017913 [Entomophthora muscae]
MAPADVDNCPAQIGSSLNVQMETHPSPGTSTKYYENEKWTPVVPGRWYTVLLFSSNPPTKQKPQAASTNPGQTIFFSPFSSISLLAYLGAYNFLGLTPYWEVIKSFESYSLGYSFFTN